MWRILIIIFVHISSCTLTDLVLPYWLLKKYTGHFNQVDAQTKVRHDKIFINHEEIQKAYSNVGRNVESSIVKSLTTLKTTKRDLMLNSIIQYTTNNWLDISDIFENTYDEYVNDAHKKRVNLSNVYKNGIFDLKNLKYDLSTEEFIIQAMNVIKRNIHYKMEVQHIRTVKRIYYLIEAYSKAAFEALISWRSAKLFHKSFNCTYKACFRKGIIHEFYDMFDPHIIVSTVLTHNSMISKEAGAILTDIDKNYGLHKYYRHNVTNRDIAVLHLVRNRIAAYIESNISMFMATLIECKEQDDKSLSTFVKNIVQFLKIFESTVKNMKPRGK